MSPMRVKQVVPGKRLAILLEHGDELAPRYFVAHLILEGDGFAPPGLVLESVERRADDVLRLLYRVEARP
jgi:hypothetical protein